MKIFRVSVKFGSKLTEIFQRWVRTMCGSVIIISDIEQDPGRKLREVTYTLHIHRTGLFVAIEILTAIFNDVKFRNKFHIMKF